MNLDLDQNLVSHKKIITF